MMLRWKKCRTAGWRLVWRPSEGGRTWYVGAVLLVPARCRPGPGGLWLQAVLLAPPPAAGFPWGTFGVIQQGNDPRTLRQKVLRFVAERLRDDAAETLAPVLMYEAPA